MLVLWATANHSPVDLWRAAAVIKSERPKSVFDFAICFMHNLQWQKLKLVLCLWQEELWIPPASPPQSPPHCLSHSPALANYPAKTVVVKWHTVFLVVAFTSPSPGSGLTVWITFLIFSYLLSHLLVIFWRLCHTVFYASISVELHLSKHTILSADRLWIVLDLYSKIC